MTEERKITIRRGLQVFLAVLGTVALSFGLLTMLVGASNIPGGNDVSASVDSELRFHAAWYAVIGALLLMSIRRVESATTIVRAVGIGAFLAGCSRIISIVVIGRPATTYLVLMGIELALPFVVVPWQAIVARRR
jgi:hypothetical protein